MSAAGVPVPYFPPIANVLARQRFEGLINAYGVRVTWQKTHLCPCTYGGPIPGSPDQACLQCLGLGWWWDSVYGPFQALITFIHMSPTPDEPGAIMDTKFGMIARSEPTLTIPYAIGSNDIALWQDILRDPDVLTETDIFSLTNTIGLPNLAWQEATINDVFVELDAITRFETELQVGGQHALPYQQNLTVAPSGAVTTYDTDSHTVVAVSGYTVSGASVTLPSSYPDGTSYVVSYTAAKAYSAWRNAGAMPHTRPFAQSSQPRRFRLQELDLWLRGTGKI